MLSWWKKEIQMTVKKNLSQSIKIKRYTAVLYILLLFVLLGFIIYLAIELSAFKSTPTIIGTFCSSDGTYAVFEDDNHYMIYNPKEHTIIEQGIYHLNTENIGYTENQKMTAYFIFNGKDKIYTKLDSQIQSYKKIDSTPAYINVQKELSD